MKQTSLKLFLAIGLGGMIGSVCRYSISLLFTGDPESFPFETLIVNLIGCFLLSFFLNKSQFKQTLSPLIFISLTTGLIGSFTTFSTFAVETVILFDFSLFLALVYMLVSIFGGLLFCYFGYRCATRKKILL